MGATIIQNQASYDGYRPLPEEQEEADALRADYRELAESVGRFAAAGCTLLQERHGYKSTQPVEACADEATDLAIDQRRRPTAEVWINFDIRSMTALRDQLEGLLELVRKEC